MVPLLSRLEEVSTFTPLKTLLLLALTAQLSTALDNGVGKTAGMGWSTWNTFGGSVSDALLRESADAMVSQGLLDAGYEYLNLDDGWCSGRDASGNMIADPKLFPDGLKPVIDYVHSKGLKFGIYSARGSLTCLGRPGSDMHEEQDAALWASWGVDYLKEDSCGGTTHGTMWEQYARMRDGLNKTGRPIYFSITQAQDWADGHPRMHCYGDGAFSTLFWTTANPPLDPRTLANSYLIEYCNGMDFFGDTDGYPNGPGGFLSNLDSQQLLTWDNMTGTGSWNDMDMLTVCHTNGTAQTWAEYSAQFSTWAILASPLIHGNDIRYMADECKAIILNKEVIAVNQDPLGIRGKLAIQWPLAVWPAVDPPAATATAGAGGAPAPTGILTLLPCNATSPSQLFAFTPAGYLQSQATGECLTYGGYKESNLAPTACTGWSVPGIGSQLWAPNASTGALHVVGNLEKVMDVLDCNVKAFPTPVQVCTGGGSDCYSGASPPPGCGPSTGQAWDFSFPAAAASYSTMESRVGGGGWCVAVAPPRPNPIDIRLQVWVKPLVDGSVAFLAFNRYTQPIQANVTWEVLGWADTQRAALRNIVNHTDLGVFAGPTFSFQVLPHTHVFIKAVPQA